MIFNYCYQYIYYNALKITCWYVIVEVFEGDQKPQYMGCFH